MLKTIAALLQSRKFITGVAGIVAAGIVKAFGIGEEAAGEISLSILGLAALIIAAIAYEDGAEKSAGGKK